MAVPFYRGGVLVLNPKCIVFGLLLIILYLMGYAHAGGDTSGMSKLEFATISAVIWGAGYVGMAEYDHAYQCQRGPMTKGDGLLSLAKSGGNSPELRTASIRDASIYVSHLLIAAVLFIASGWLSVLPGVLVSFSRDLLPVMAVLAVAYHGYQLYNMSRAGTVVAYNMRVVAKNAA